jgi:hypothetical protein
MYVLLAQGARLKLLQAPVMMETPLSLRYLPLPKGVVAAIMQAMLLAVMVVLAVAVLAVERPVRLVLG